MDAPALVPRAALIDGVPYVGATRGPIVESVHRVAVCAVDRSGRTAYAVGAVDVPVYLRSTAKPFIAAAAVDAGVVERFGLTPPEIAVMAASHNGEPAHVDAVRSILRKAGIAESALRCGPHAPYDPVAAAALVRDGVPFSAIHNNCSGKHAGILAMSALLGAELDGYLEPAHPAQQRILALCARLCGLPLSGLPLGVDGCGIPVFATPLRNAALAFSRLATLDGIEPADARALKVVRDAMIANPFYVAGTDEFDTALMRVAGGCIAVKSGAEGVCGIAGVDAGLGLALKVVDGAARACPPAAMAAVARLGLLDAPALEELEPFARPPIVNRAGRTVGELVPLDASGTATGA